MYQVFELPHDFLDRDYTEQEKAGFDQKIWEAIHGPETQLHEELTDKQKRKVDSWDTWQDAAVKKAHESVFGKGIDRIIVPYSDSDEDKITTHNYHLLSLHNRVQGAANHATVLRSLASAGYHTDDYVSGLAYHKDKPERKMKIRKAMSIAGIDNDPAHGHRTAPSTDANGVFTAGRTLTLGEVYDSDPIRAASKAQKQIVFTRNKYDVAGMSTNRGWSSCMDMVDGCNKRYLPKDIEHGTVTAYLTHKGDDGVSKPIGRINLKRFDGANSHTIFRAEKSSYGTVPKGFRKAVNEWAEKNYESKPGVYSKHASLYNDDGKSLLFEKIDQISGSDIGKAAETAAHKIIRSAHDYDGDKMVMDYHDAADEVKNNAYTAAHSIMEHLDHKQFAKEVIHHVADHSIDHDGDNQEVETTKFSNEDPSELHGSDVMHHWGIQQMATGSGSQKVVDGLASMSHDELHHSIEKIHKAMAHSPEGQHYTLKEIYSHAVDEAFSRDTPNIHSTILHHMTDPKNQEFHSDMMSQHSTIFDQKHPLELTHDPRMMHHILENDHSHFTVSDPFSYNVMHHVGQHADAKVAHAVIHHVDIDDDSRRGLIKGLNDNPHGEAIQHHLVNDMLLTGGKYHGNGMMRDITSKSDLAHATRGYHHGFPRIHGFNPEQTDHEEDYVEKFADIANYTKFPSVYNRIKKRAEPGGDLDHESIHDGIKFNTKLKEHFELPKEDKRRFKDFLSIIDK